MSTQAANLFVNTMLGVYQARMTTLMRLSTLLVIKVGGSDQAVGRRQLPRENVTVTEPGLAKAQAMQRTCKKIRGG